MKAAPLEIMPSSSARLYGLAPDYQPELKPGHVLCDQSLPVEERIQLAQAESIRVLNNLRPLGEAGDTRSQIEFAKEAKVLQWLCQSGAAEWVEEHYPQRQDILGKYRYQLLDDGFVRFTIPEGRSFLDLFEEANRYCKECGRPRPAMRKSALEFFAKRAEATSEIERPETHEIQGLVPDSLYKTRAQQEEFLAERGLSLPTLEAVAAAAALYYCATGESLFEDRWVGTAAPGLELKSSSVGLVVLAFVGDDNRSDFVGCAASRNLKT